MKPSQSMLNNDSITYRNAIYQGAIDPNKQVRKDFGILYMAKTHQFIVCNNWHNDYLEGECLFYNDDQKFVYGTWINNKPQGFNVFRFNDILVMTEFNRGRLNKNTPILLVFEKYNIAAILIVVNQPEGLDDLQLQIYDKKEVFTSQEVRQLFHRCQWPDDYFTHNQTLVKYISSKLSKQPLAKQNKYQPNPCKLRLIENKYYRFGYDDGLAIVFDEDFNRVSVGSHFKSKLKSFGIKFDRPQKLMEKPDKGKIIKLNAQNTTLRTAIKNQLERPQKENHIQHKNISKANLLTGVNFCNKFYKNPSKLFQFYIQNMINQASIRNLIAGSLTTRRVFEESLQFSRIDTNRGNNNTREQLFDQNKAQTLSNVNSQKQKQSSSRLSKDKIIEDRLRLQAIKKEIYGSLEKKKHKIQKQIMNEEYKRDIINKEIVGKSYYHTPQRTLDKSRSRKKIFEQSQKNLKLLRDFTPSRSQPNLTPFKSKMKNRIFNGESSKVSDGKRYHPTENTSKSKNKHKNYDNSEQIQIRPGVLKNYNQFSSGDSLDERDSNVFQRSKNKNYLKKQETKQQHQFSLNDYHVSFEDQNIKRSNVSSKKYPSQSGKNHNYVPINTSEVKQRKKLSQNWISIQDHEQNQQKNTESRKKQQVEVQNDKRSKKIENERRPQDERNFSLQQKQQIMPEKIYYHQKSMNEDDNIRQSYKIIHRNQQTNDKGKRSREGMLINKQQNLGEEEKSIKRQDERNYLVEKYDQIQNRKKQQPKQSIRKQIYNEETFKQNTFSQQFQNTTNFDQSKRSAFKHSNQVYLDQYQQNKNSQSKPIETQKKRTIQNAFQYTQNKSTTSIPRDENKQKSKQGGVSYLQKHKIKKSVQKDIQRSPDRHRCYGKSGNSPYLDNSPSYSKDLSYHNSTKQIQQRYRRSQTQYDDSSYKIVKKQIPSGLRNYPNRLF